MFSTIKTYAIAVAGAAFAALIIAVRVLSGQKAKLKAENKQKEAQNEHLTDVLEADIDINEQTDVHLVDVVKEIKESGFTAELSEPNED